MASERKALWGRHQRLVGVSLLATLLLGLHAAAEPPDCRPGRLTPLVDNVFRDAALATIAKLAIHAPGQAADGAVAASQSPAHVDPNGHAWHYVSAYHVNLALASALRLAPQQLLPVAARWLDWQMRHTTFTAPGQGMVFDHWVRTSDLFEAPCPPGLPRSACPQVDAYDSTAASLLLMADAFVAAGGDANLLRAPAQRRVLEGAVGTLTALTQANGLSWAKPGHQVAYLMDNVEVAAGWRAWSRLQLALDGPMRDARAGAQMAKRIDAALLAELWHAPSGTWRVSQGAAAPALTRWYPDTMAQAWPLLWSSTLPAERALQAWQTAVGHWREGAKDWAQRNVDTDDFWWPATAVAAHCAGDTRAAQVWLARARAQWMRPQAPFAWPFQVGDLHWLFQLAEPVP